MRDLQRECGHAGSPAGFVEALRRDPRHYARDAEELLARASWIAKRVDMSHPVMQQLPQYLDKIIQTTELRLMRMGMIDKPLAQMSRFAKFGAITRSLSWKFGRKFAFWKWFSRKPRLTDSYMSDPYLAEVMKLAEIKAGLPIAA